MWSGNGFSVARRNGMSGAMQRYAHDLPGWAAGLNTQADWNCQLIKVKAMAIDWSKTFKSEYDAARAEIAKNGDFEKDWRSLIKDLEQLLGAVGFDAGKEHALGKLRQKIKEGVSKTSISEDKGILQAVGAWTENNIGTVNADAKKRAACLKFLRHIYLQNKAGNRKVWVFSLPVEFTDWPSRYLSANASTVGAAKTLLASSNEHFSDQQKRYLGNSTQQAIAWCQKAGIVLANAAAASGTGPNLIRDNARTLVKRWFAETSLGEITLNTYITTLAAGFKSIIAALTKGHFVVTDWVPFRGTSDVDEADFLASEAFTFGGFGEGMDVVYIESNFFVNNAGNVVNGQTNWTRILVHELSHLVCDTEDVNNGQARYAWYGIGPHAGYPGSDCIRNADNWAFFAADCENALTEGQRNTALKII